MPGSNRHSANCRPYFSAGAYSEILEVVFLGASKVKLFFPKINDRSKILNLQKIKFLKNELFKELLSDCFGRFSFFYSIYLWFTGNELEGIYVGLWPVTILGFAIAIRQRRKDALNKDSDAK
jgi:hypothetical protein